MCCHDECDDEDTSDIRASEVTSHHPRHPHIITEVDCDDEDTSDIGDQEETIHVVDRVVRGGAVAGWRGEQRRGWRRLAPDDHGGRRTRGCSDRNDVGRLEAVRAARNRQRQARTALFPSRLRPAARRRFPYIAITATNIIIVLIIQFNCLFLFVLANVLTFTFAIRHRPSVCRLSVCLSVTFVHPTQAVDIFGNVSTLFVPWPSVTFR